MNFKKNVPLLVAALVLGLALGNVLSGFAAPSTDATAPSGAAGLGLHLGQAMRDAGGRLADVAAKLTGLDVEDVEEQRHAGTSFADIAESKGVTADELVDEALKVRKQVLDGKVKAGEITQDQADDALARMQGRLSDRVDSTDQGFGGRGMGRRGGGCGGGGRGAGAGSGACGGACGAAQAPVVTQ